MEGLPIAESSFNTDEVGITLVKVMAKIVCQIVSKVNNYLMNERSINSINRMLLILHGMNKKSGG